MKPILIILITLVSCLTMSFDLFAQGFYVYPTKGQSQEQTERDKVDCQVWAKQQTGYDPMQPATASSPPPSSQAPQGGVVRGAARGATVGVVGGAIAGDAGKGAAVGAGTGAVVGGMRRRDQWRREQEAQRQYQQQQAAQQAQARDQFNRAYKTCLQGRGYTVN